MRFTPSSSGDFQATATVQARTKKDVDLLANAGLDRVHAVRSFSGLGPVPPTKTSYQRGRAQQKQNG